MERYWVANGILASNECGGLVKYDDAQRALDAERARVKELEAELEEYRSIAEQQGASKAVSQLATLQAQLRQVEGERAKWEDIAGLRFAGDHKFVKEMELLKVENTTLRQLVEALPVVDGEITELTACVAVRGHRVTYATIRDLLKARATLAAQDAGKEDVSHE